MGNWCERLVLCQQRTIIESHLLSAKEMDRRLKRVGIDMKYYERFEDIALYVYNQSLNDFSADTSFTLDKLDQVEGPIRFG